MGVDQTVLICRASHVGIGSVGMSISIPVMIMHACRSSWSVGMSISIHVMIMHACRSCGRFLS